MVLYREGRVFKVFYTFDGFVIVVDMSYFQIRSGNRRFSYGVAMVLRSDIATARGEIFHWVVTAAMTKFQLFSICSTCKSQQLMTKANSEDWILSKQLGDHFNCVRNIFRVPGAIRQLDSIRAQTADFVSRCIMRYDYDVAISFIQLTKNPALRTKIYEDDPFFGTWTAVHMTSRCTCYLIAKLVNASRSHHFLQLLNRFRGGSNDPLHCSVVTNDASQHSSIDIRNSWDIIILQKVAQIVLRSPVTWRWFISAHNKSVNRRCDRFEIIS
ncbi:hypothetical protein D3C78_1165170 [compost metagenome]